MTLDDAAPPCVGGGMHGLVIGGPRIEARFEPVLCRDFDWSAIDAATYDGLDCPIGFGPTREAAIADLMQQLEEDV